MQKRIPMVAAALLLAAGATAAADLVVIGHPARSGARRRTRWQTCSSASRRR